MHVNRKRFHQQPCLRCRISCAELLYSAVCSSPKTLEYVDIPSWESSDIETISIVQDDTSTSYDLKVRKFIPVEFDAMERGRRTNEVKQAFQSSPYAIADMKEASQTLLDYADVTLEKAIHHYVGWDNLLRETYRETYLMAHKCSKYGEVGSPRLQKLHQQYPDFSVYPQHQEERSLLCAVLQLWRASRMDSCPRYICGSESSDSRKIHLPPILITQMEVMVTALMLKPAKKDVLRLLSNLLKENRRRSWFAIYLAMFILLNNCAILTREKADKQGLPVCT